MKYFLLIISFSMSAFIMNAQEIQKSKQIYEFLKNGQGDSVYAKCNTTVKSMISAQQLSNIFSTMENQAGKLRGEKNFVKRETGGQTFYSSDLDFERMPLRFLLSYDKGGLISTLRFVPVPATEEESQPSVDEGQENDPAVGSKVVVVRTGDFSMTGIYAYPKKTPAPYPVVILVHGSGPHDRNETIGPNKPFEDIARGLAENGIASIRYDKRTYLYGAQSIHPGDSLTTDVEVCQDALSAIRVATQEPSADKSRIFLAGHSLGAMMAPRIALRSSLLKGIILISGPARKLEDVILDQVNYLSAGNPSKATQEQIAALKRQTENIKKLDTKYFNSKIASPLNLPLSYWRDLNRYDQVKTAQNLNIPILILQGGRDYQVTPEDFHLWENALKEKKNVVFKFYPTLNHLYMEGKGKAQPEEYNKAGHFSPLVIKDMADWIKSCR